MPVNRWLCANSVFLYFMLRILEIRTGKHSHLPKQHYEKIDARTDAMKACAKSLYGKSRAVYIQKHTEDTSPSEWEVGKSLRK